MKINQALFDETDEDMVDMNKFREILTLSLSVLSPQIIPVAERKPKEISDLIKKEDYSLQPNQSRSPEINSPGRKQTKSPSVVEISPTVQPTPITSVRRSRMSCIAQPKAGGLEIYTGKSKKIDGINAFNVRRSV